MTTVNFCQMPDGTYVACLARHMITVQGEDTPDQRPPALDPPLDGSSFSSIVDMAQTVLRICGDWEVPPDNMDDQLLELYRAMGEALSAAKLAAGLMLQVALEAAPSDPEYGGSPPTGPLG